MRIFELFIDFHLDDDSVHSDVQISRSGLRDMTAKIAERHEIVEIVQGEIVGKGDGAGRGCGEGGELENGEGGVEDEDVIMFVQDREGKSVEKGNVSDKRRGGDDAARRGAGIASDNGVAETDIGAGVGDRGWGVRGSR